MEFEFRPDGRLRYANNSNYKNDVMIRKECASRCVEGMNEPPSAQFALPPFRQAAWDRQSWKL